LAADELTASYTRLIVERLGPVGWIVNDRPEVLNAYDDSMRGEFRRAYRAHEEDPAVRVIVHAARGRAFQVGADIADFNDDEGTSRYEREVREFDLGLTSWQLGVTKPVVIAINGVCAGGGLHWLADGDVVLAASDAMFVDPHVSIGQVAAFEPIGLARRGAFEAIMRMALLGRHERMSAARACELGLVSQVVDPPEDLHRTAQTLAEQIAEADPEEQRARKAGLWQSQEFWRSREFA
jgi:enoyl-CoA hydratase/carnithine racemase